MAAQCVKLKINEDKRRTKRIEEITNLIILSCMLKKKNEKRREKRIRTFGMKLRRSRKTKKMEE